MVIPALMLLFAAASARAQALFNITSATYGTAGATSVPAGINGVTLELGGTLPTAAQQLDPGYLGCFYTGSGSTTGIPLSAPNGTNAEPLTVPASTIQSVLDSQFTAANGYSVTAYVYIVAAGGACDGTFDPALTNRFPVSVVAPSLGAYAGPVTVPQTNSATLLQAAPTTLTLPANGVLPAGSTAGTTSIKFGNFGSVTRLPSLGAFTVLVPPAFSSSAAGTTASLTVCNTFGTKQICTTPTPAITITVAALVASSGTITATPPRGSVTGQTVLTAQFTKAAGATGDPGAPSGVVTFSAAGATVAPAPLVLDKTATFVSQTTAITPPRPPTHLAFQVQPVDTALNTAITPAVQVALLDATGAVAQGSTLPVTIALQANPGESTLAGTKTINAVNGIATFSELSINHLATGYTLSASSGTLVGAVSNAFNITPPPITLTLQSTLPAGLVGEGATLNGSFTLGVAAPTGGVTVNLSSGTPATVTIAPATVTVAAGQTAGAFTYTGGTNAGSSTLTASATGYQTGTVVATATAAQVSLTGPSSVAPGQTHSLALSLPTTDPAPPGGTTVTFTTANPNIATVTSSIFVPGGQFTAAANPQIAGVLIGTTTVTANAPGYAPATLPVNVTVTASFNPGATYINLINSTNTVLQISAPAPVGGIKFNLTSSDPTKATVPATVTVIQGGTNVKVPITGVADGTVTIAATSPGITEADGTVVVNSQITSPDFTTGYDLEGGQGYGLPVTPSVPTNVTFKVSDPTVAIISTSQSAVGQQAVVFSNVTTGSIGTLYIQGKKVGTTTLTISAPGYTTGTETITVSNTGFAYYYYNQTLTETDYDGPRNETVYPTPLNADGSIYGPNFTGWIVNPGSTAISIPIASSAPAVGTVTSPIVFHALDTAQAFTFTPVSAGTTNLAIGNPPTGFLVPTQSGTPQYQQIVATISTPVITAPTATTGVHLQIGIGINLPVTPPTSVYPNGVTVTVTVTPSAAGVPLAATLSKSNTVAGIATQTFTNVTSTYAGPLQLQGLSAGTATITVSAPGYASGTATITVQPSGFAYYYNNYYSQTINTTSFSGTNTLTVYPFLLDGNSAESGYPSYTLNPGVGPVTVPITDSNTAVGTISASSLVFNTNDNYQQFTFQPASAGTTNITLGNVTGFTKPTTYQQVVATVTAPAISINAPTTGVHLQQQMGISLPVPPPSSAYPNGDTVTVTSSAPGVVTLSKDNVTVGTTSLTFTNVTTSGLPTIYVQGQSVGTATITMSAPGYVSGSSTLTVLHSGFGFYPTEGNVNTTTFSSANSNTLTIYSLLLDANNDFANPYGLGLSPGVGPVTVPIADSNTGVGTISSNALVFNTNDTYKQFTFQPVAAGTANLTVSQPAGFTAPKATSSAGVATVTAPGISVDDSLTGINLETTIRITLQQIPPNPVMVTVKSNGPLIAVLSNGATVAGTGTLIFNNVTQQDVATIYVQGLTEGATTLKVTAGGYTDGDANIKVDPSGFSRQYDSYASITTSVGSTPSQIPVYPVALVHGTLTPDTYNNLYVSPSAGTVNVPITSSAPGVGTVVNPLVFAPGASYGYLTFTPVATGTSTLTIGTPTGFSVPTNYTTSTATVQ